MKLRPSMLSLNFFFLLISQIGCDFEVSVLCIIVLGLSICDLYGISLFQFSRLIIGNENFAGSKERNLMEIKLVKNMNMYIYIYIIYFINFFFIFYFPKSMCQVCHLGCSASVPSDPDKTKWKEANRFGRNG
jgi:hypothetical protein